MTPYTCVLTVALFSMSLCACRDVTMTVTIAPKSNSTNLHNISNTIGFPNRTTGEAAGAIYIGAPPHPLHHPLAERPLAAPHALPHRTLLQAGYGTGGQGGASYGSGGGSGVMGYGGGGVYGGMGYGGGYTPPSVPPSVLPSNLPAPVPAPVPSSPKNAASPSPKHSGTRRSSEMAHGLILSCTVILVIHLYLGL